MAVLNRLLSLLIGLACLFTIAQTQQEQIRPYPLSDAYLQTTSFLDHESYITQYADQQWLLDNIPFIDIPDKNVQDIYYYRATVIKRHLKWTHEGQGWVFTEFIHPVSWASKLQTIPDSAAYHILEGRWLRDQNIAKNLIEQYTRGGVEALSGITYTNFVIRATLEHAQATGNTDFLTSQLQGMIASFYLWNSTRDATTGLYHRTPLSDAQEYSLPGFLTGGPGGGPMQVWDDFGLTTAEGGGNNYDTIWLGPETYRPSFMSYMIANSYAISQVASLAGESDLAATWSAYGDDLFTAMRDIMWSEELQFWIDVVEGTNLDCQGRELIGYYPYRFGIGTNLTYVRGLEYALNTEHFITEYGPTTLERTNPYYTALKNTTYCCLWNGQSWPFSTSVYLNVLADLARTNLSTVATSSFFYDALVVYANTQYKAGEPYVAESHYPEFNMWSGDTTNHSENYFHSTYANNIFVDLIGVTPTLDDVLWLQPLVPSNWTYFAVENLPYHGTLITIIWDQAGGHYGNSTSGLSIYSNGTLIHNQKTLAAVNVTLPFNSQEASTYLGSQPEYQNILANPNSPWGLPVAEADYIFASNGDGSSYLPFKLNDGLLWYDTVPDNRWTNNQSETPFNTITVTLPRARNISSVSLAIFSDIDRAGVIACPAGYRITDLTNNNTVVALSTNWSSCVPNSVNTILFAAPSTDTSNATTPQTGTGYEVETQSLSIELNDQLRLAVAVSEVQIWVPPTLGPRYEVEDGMIGTFIGYFEGRATGVNGTIIDGGVQLGSNGWVEVAGVMAPANVTGQGGLVPLAIMGGMTGTVDVKVNYLHDYSLSFDGTETVIIEVEMLPGKNNFDFIQTSGTPWIDAFVVG